MLPLSHLPHNRGDINNEYSKFKDVRHIAVQRAYHASSIDSGNCQRHTTRESSRYQWRG
jgi:hypothetical protein